MTIGQSIRATRKAKGFSQEELARKAGIWQPVISSWELDRVNPTIPLLICIADVLGVTLDELVGRNVQDNKKNFPKTY